mmetsp:Transcript_114397/g.324053  ORF Transcript_114397/g.324053 Transcript_114397/m.324053 type:complete len:212 (+) Transcript_114397:457-1092(+)
MPRAGAPALARSLGGVGAVAPVALAATVPAVQYGAAPSARATRQLPQTPGGRPSSAAPAGAPSQVGLLRELRLRVPALGVGVGVLVLLLQLVLVAPPAARGAGLGQQLLQPPGPLQLAEARPQELREPLQGHDVPAHVHQGPEPLHLVVVVLLVLAARGARPREPVREPAVRLQGAHPHGGGRPVGPAGVQLRRPDVAEVAAARVPASVRQ